MRNDETGDSGDGELENEPGAAGEAGMALLGHLQVIVVEADAAEAERHSEHDPDIGVAGLAHRIVETTSPDKIISPPMVGVPTLGDEMGLRAVGADRLPFALLQAKHGDDARAEQEYEDESGDDGAAGTECDVAKDVEYPDVSDNSASQ